MEREAFEDMVSDVLDRLPADFAEMLERENIEIEVSGAPSRQVLERQGLGPGETLLGLYSGSPMTRRGWGYNLVLPDRITIYQASIEAFCRQSGESLDDVVRRVVIHEIAHHYGISDARLRELGY